MYPQLVVLFDQLELNLMKMMQSFNGYYVRFMNSDKIRRGKQ